MIRKHKKCLKKYEPYSVLPKNGTVHSQNCLPKLTAIQTKITHHLWPFNCFRIIIVLNTQPVFTQHHYKLSIIVTTFFVLLEKSRRKNKSLAFKTRFVKSETCAVFVKPSSFVSANPSVQDGLKNGKCFFLPRFIMLETQEIIILYP